MGLVQIVVCFSALLAIAFSACPTGWKHHAGKCYKFSTGKQNWVDARSMCKFHNSDLIEIETDTEQHWVRQQALKFNHTDLDDGFWIGGTDWGNEGTWIWEPSQTPISYIVWGQGQPNNRNNSENCLASMKYFDYIWSDEFCDWDRLQYICEMADTSGPIVG
uniref:C-type lectin n=1 Tax=Meretrix meretrix TaxID=291251 RepID=A0A173DQE7_MERMT|nr:C-type lectin [Meretrix meretrix]